VCVLESENKHLRLDIERLKKQAAHWSSLEERNISVDTIKKLREKADRGKQLEEENAQLREEINRY